MDRNREQLLDDAKRAAREEFDAGREAFAAEVLRSYLVHRPNDEFAWFIYGDALRILGRSRAAYRALRHSLRLTPKPHRFQIRARLGMLAQAVGKRQGAERWYSRACNDPRSQSSDWLWVMRGANLAVAERHAEAENCFQQAISINQRNDEAYLNLGTLYRGMGRFEDALRILRHGYLLDPTSNELRNALDGLESIGNAIAWIEQLEGKRGQNDSI